MNQQQLPFEFPSKMDFYFKIGFSKPCLFICKENVRNIHIVIWQNYKQIFQKLRSLHSRFPDNIIHCVFCLAYKFLFEGKKKKSFFCTTTRKLNGHVCAKLCRGFFMTVCFYLSRPFLQGCIGPKIFSKPWPLEAHLILQTSNFDLMPKKAKIY